MIQERETGNKRKIVLVHTIERGKRGGKIFILSCKEQNAKDLANSWLKGQFALSEGQKKNKRRSLSRSDKWGNVL